jgi:methionyl aminopeptidase
MNLRKGEIITLKDNVWLQRQKTAGKVLADLHNELFQMIKVGYKKPLYHLDAFANNFILSNNCTPSFYQYNGFPSSICVSINKELVHGFGNRDIILKEGDVVTIDAGTTFQGAIADCAISYVVGQPKNDSIVKLLTSCQNSLNNAIGVFSPGKTIGDIGEAISKVGKEDGFGVIVNYGGHGLDYDTLHTSPFVSNDGKSGEGISIQPGMSIAIEPMFVLGKNIRTKILRDNWTVITNDIGVHFEHSVTLDEEGKCHIITEHGITVKDMF